MVLSSSDDEEDNKSFSHILTNDQYKAFNKMKMKENLLITGPAGTGKSFLIDYYKRWCENNGYRFSITALTGCAAYLIKGNTLHSWGGIGCGTKDYRSLLKKIRRNKKAKERWLSTQILIIDEISMLTPELLEKLDIIGKLMRKNECPFGGIQLILTGDFYQLPPVSDNQSEKTFCFESEKWDIIIDDIVELNEIVRQIDPSFQKCLNEVRIGKCSLDTKKLLHDCAKKDKKLENGIIPTRLYSKNENVNMINDIEIKKLGTKIIDYNVETKVSIDPTAKLPDEYVENLIKIIDDSAQFDSELKLAIGAQVMLLTNLDVPNGFVNGSRGIVVGFDNGLPIVRFMNGGVKTIQCQNWDFNNDPAISIIKTQLPLKLAWAITIHKIQGSTLDLVEINIGKDIFEYGQSYVALSRVKNVEGLYISSLKFKRIQAHPKVIQFYKDIKNRTVKKNKITQFFNSL